MDSILTLDHFDNDYYDKLLKNYDHINVICTNARDSVIYDEKVLMHYAEKIKNLKCTIKQSEIEIAKITELEKSGDGQDSPRILSKPEETNKLNRQKEFLKRYLVRYTKVKEKLEKTKDFIDNIHIDYDFAQSEIKFLSGIKRCGQQITIDKQINLEGYYTLTKVPNESNTYTFSTCDDKKFQYMVLSVGDAIYFTQPLHGFSGVGITRERIFDSAFRFRTARDIYDTTKFQIVILRANSNKRSIEIDNKKYCIRCHYEITDAPHSLECYNRHHETFKMNNIAD